MVSSYSRWRIKDKGDESRSVDNRTKVERAFTVPGELTLGLAILQLCSQKSEERKINSLHSDSESRVTFQLFGCEIMENVFIRKYP